MAPLSNLEVSYLEERLKLLVKKQEELVESDNPGQENQTKDEQTCPLPPMDGYPECEGKLKWMKTMWRSDPCYSSSGVNGSLCSFLIYLSEVERWCPVLPGRVIPSALPDVPVPAVVQDSLTGLYPALANRIQFRWIQQRISSMEEIWVKAGHTLSAKYNLTGRMSEQILVHPGLVTDESGFKMAQSAFTGGPLGELVQWSDLISTLYILGHHLHLSASIPDLKQCKVRVLDSFGTEPDFNHEAWAKSHSQTTFWGGLNLIPMQFYTMFPHTPDNTFLGFVVEQPLSSEEAQRLQSTKRNNQALVYGKKAEFWKGKRAYLDLIHEHFEIHGTAVGGNPSLVPSYVKNHGLIKGTEVQTLLRQSKVFVGLSFPYEGPAPLEAIANGCAFLNPRLHPPQSSLNTAFFKGKPNIREVTSQHPYAEAIGEPYVWTIDMDNPADVQRAISAILKQTIEPYLPYEFTCEGMLQRVNTFIEKQDFCHGPVNWPPLSALQVVMAKTSTSCKQECQEAGLICEPAFFPHLNSAEDLAKYGVHCLSSNTYDGYLTLPAYNNRTNHCLFQSDPLLFSCVRSDPDLSLIRICPCRDYIKDQIALCKACV
ncbi:alpha-1,6-mannosylglycoprotein 6-beta-N-acetylglucosaminyltransferase A-like [Polymixia lowei]